MALTIYVFKICDKQFTCFWIGGGLGGLTIPQNDGGAASDVSNYPSVQNHSSSRADAIVLHHHYKKIVHAKSWCTLPESFVWESGWSVVHDRQKSWSSGEADTIRPTAVSSHSRLPIGENYLLLAEQHQQSG